VAESHLSGRELVVEYRSGEYVVRPIDGLSFDVDSGHLALLLGASGCGKTTLLSILASILKPVSGTVRLGEIDITALSGDDLTDYRRHSVGVVFQAFNLVPSLTASENVQVPLRATGASGRAARDRADALLDQVGLADRGTHRPADLSGGQQQRVAIARALALDPPLVLADEPTAHLDYMQVESVLQLLREIADSGRIVVVSTHDERMIPLADTVVAMSPRALAVDGGPREARLAAGQMLFRQGDPGDLVYMVEEGSIEIVRERADGGEEVLAHIGPGNYFGELAPLFGIRRSATARTTADTRLTAMSVMEFRRQSRGHRLWRALEEEGDPAER
jgi:putative ABC transport system ATP-binding protein